MEDLGDVMKGFLAAMSLDERLAGLTPDQRLAGLTPGQRLAGLTPEQIASALATRPESEQVLAMPHDLWRLLPDEYVATLPDDVRAKVRARRG